jgi:hypothetical protein
MKRQVKVDMAEFAIALDISFPELHHYCVEREDPYRDYSDMERFSGTVEDPNLEERLWSAIRGRGAFRRFKDLVARHPDVEQEWFELKDARLRRDVADWREANDIEPV